MRPKYRSWLGGRGSALWQFNADTHVTDWLEAAGYGYDCLSDEDLHYQGEAALGDYDVLVTSSHSEYWSKEMWDAVDAFRGRGGRIISMGGNTWYWRVAFNPSVPGVMEVRRNEDGTRAWAAEPGEYYHSFTGEYGGLWRRQGRPPQMIAGNGFIAQGFDDSSYYLRQEGSFDPRARFIFEGIADDERIGDFGLVGNGAAGLELDHVDRLLGSPPNTLVLASSTGHSDIYQVVAEEILINYPHRRHRQPAGEGGHGLLRDGGRRGGVLDRVHRLGRQSVAQRLRQQRVPDHAQRPEPLPDPEPF